MKKMMQKGFTLIELMIVVAIIAILAAIAIPAYQDYLIRSQVSEGLALSAGAKTAVAEYYSNTGAAPSTNVIAGIAPATDIKGKYVTGVAISGAGLITATYGNKANTAITGKTMIMTPVFNDGSTDWTCLTGSVIAKYRPTTCR